MAPGRSLALRTQEQLPSQGPDSASALEQVLTDYGESRDVYQGDLLRTGDIVASLPDLALHKVYNGNGLALRDPNWHPKGPGYYWRDSRFIPAGRIETHEGEASKPETPFDAIFGSIALCEVEADVASMGRQVLSRKRYKLVNLLVGDGEVVTEALRLARKESDGQEIPYNPESFRDPGLPGEYLLGIRDVVTGEYKFVSESISYNNIVPETFIVAKDTPEGEELFVGIPPEIMQLERAYMMRMEITDRDLLSALQLKQRIVEHVNEKGERDMDYEAILRTLRPQSNDDPSPIVVNNPGYASMRGELQQLLRLPERPGVSDSYLWRFYQHCIQEAGIDPETGNIRLDPETLSQNLYYYYAMSEAKIKLLNGSNYTAEYPFRLLNIVGSLDAWHDPILRTRHAEAKLVFKSHCPPDEYAKMDDEKLRRAITGSLYFQNALREEDPHMDHVIVFPLGQRFPAGTRIPPIPPSFSLGGDSFDSLVPIFEELVNGFPPDTYPKTPGIIALLTRGDTQFFVMRVDSSMGVIKEYAANHAHLELSLREVISWLRDSRIPSPYCLVEETGPEDPRGWKIAASTMPGKSLVLEAVATNPNGGRHIKLHAGGIAVANTINNEPPALSSGRRARRNKGGRADVEAFRGGIGEKEQLYPVIPTLASRETAGLPTDPKVIVSNAALLIMQEPDGAVRVMADSSNGAEIIAPSYTGRRRS